jgi:ubiquinone/menaquinone biosynthesis C-methylase UbiE
MTASSTSSSHAPRADGSSGAAACRIDPHTDDVDDRLERRRILRIYEAYERDPARIRAWSEGPSVAFFRRRKWKAIRELVAELSPVRGARRFLDLGAWNGVDTVHLLDMCPEGGTVVALDLLEHPLRKARQLSARLDCVVAHASSLPFPNDAVDLIYQSTMLSSVLSSVRRTAILGEIRRVLAPGGLFISFDMRYTMPLNRGVRRVSLAELKAFFREWSSKARTTTLLPPLLRRLAPLSETACAALESIPVLRSHLLFGARKPV